MRGCISQNIYQYLEVIRIRREAGRGTLFFYKRPGFGAKVLGPHSSPLTPPLGLRGAILDWMLPEGPRPFLGLAWFQQGIPGALRHTGHRFTAGFSQLTGLAAAKALLGAGTGTVSCLSCSIPQGWHKARVGLQRALSLLRLSTKKSLTPSSQLSKVTPSTSKERSVGPEGRLVPSYRCEN